jgi:hypothetical protein
MIELVLATSVLSVVAIISLSSLTSLGKASNRGVGEQEVARIGGRLLDQIARELRYADAGTLLYSPLEPDRITFQEVLAYEADPTTDGSVILSRPVTLRRVLLAGSTSRFGVERSEANALVGSELVAICVPANAVPDGEEEKAEEEEKEGEADEEDGGGRQTLTVCVADLEGYLAAGATLGPCGQEPIPVAASVYGVAPRILGQVAERDLDDSGLPGLHFAVRTVGGRTLIDVAVTVTVQAGAEVSTRRFATSVALVNR